MVYSNDDSMQKWGNIRKTVPGINDNVEHDIIDLTIAPDDDDNNNSKRKSSNDDSQPVIETLGDSADSDIQNNFTMDHFLPEDPEGDLEDTIATDMPRSYGVQSFEETTFYPGSNKSISRFYNTKK